VRHQQGFSYVMVMFLVAVLSIVSVRALENSMMTERRQKEAQLLQVGKAYRDAIGAYYNNSPGTAKQFPRTVDELLPQTRKLAVLLHAWVKAECERLGLPQADFHFTRRQAREAVGWGDTQMKVHLGRLCELEFLVAHRGRQGQSFDYELIYTGEDADGRAQRLGLIDGAALQDASTTVTSRGEDPHFAGRGRGLVGGWSGDGRGSVAPFLASADAALSEEQPSPRVESHDGLNGTVLSYLPSLAAGH